MGKFYIKKKGDHFRFCLKARNGQVLLSSEGYLAKSACENGIASVRTNSQDKDQFEIHKAKNGQPYFNLKAKNGQVVAKSGFYLRNSALQNGITSVMKNAIDAEIIDNS